MNYKTFIEWGYDLKNLCRLRRVSCTETELFLLKTGRLEQSLELLKKSWNLQSNFPDVEECKIEMKSGKMVKSRSFYPELKSYSILSVIKKFNHRMRSCRTLLCFALHRGYCTFEVHREKSFLVPAFFKVSVDHLFDNLESGNFGSKNHTIPKEEGLVVSFSPLNSNCYNFFLISDNNASDDCLKVRNVFLF